jgi:hypothetical protein
MRRRLFRRCIDSQHFAAIVQRLLGVRASRGIDEWILFFRLIALVVDFARRTRAVA